MEEGQRGRHRQARVDGKSGRSRDRGQEAERGRTQRGDRHGEGTEQGEEESQKRARERGREGGGLGKPPRPTAQHRALPPQPQSRWVVQNWDEGCI